jgi:hypothetical protein
MSSGKIGKFIKSQRLQIWMRYGRWAYLVAGLCIGAIAFSGAAIAQSVMVVEQGKGGRYGAWAMEGAVADGASAASVKPVTVAGVDPGTGLAQNLQVDATGALVTAGASTSSDYVPAVPTNVACSANVSCAITGLTTEKTYQFSCSADFSYRAGTGTPTAVATDHDAKGGVMYRQMLGSSATAFAFISGSATTCKVGLVPDAP